MDQLRLTQINQIRKPRRYIANQALQAYGRTTIVAASLWKKLMQIIKFSRPADILQTG
jgi:hypothetical protein